MKKRLIRISIFTMMILAGFLPFSCAKGSMKEAAANYGRNAAGQSHKVRLFKDEAVHLEQAVPESVEAAAGQEEAAEVTERKLIKEGELRFETADMQATRQKIEALVKTCNAYISKEDEESTATMIYQNITVRIPKLHFDRFVTDLTDGIKKIDYKTIDIQDVTEEFIDISARLKVKKETEVGYLRLLQQAKTVKDILDIQNQIQDLRSDIESIEGRLRYLENSVNFSTLHIRMYQPIESPKTAGSFVMPLWEAVKGGTELFVDFILAVLYGWVFIVVIGVMLFCVLRIRKRKHKKSTEKKEPEDFCTKC